MVPTCLSCLRLSQGKVPHTKQASKQVSVCSWQQIGIIQELVQQIGKFHEAPIGNHNKGEGATWLLLMSSLARISHRERLRLLKRITSFSQEGTKENGPHMKSNQGNAGATFKKERLNMVLRQRARCCICCCPFKPGRSAQGCRVDARLRYRIYVCWIPLVHVRHGLMLPCRHS